MRLINFIVLVIAFQVLNMSIDSPNAIQDNYYNVPDNFNNIDTYVEYISEVICKNENAIPETEKRHQKQWQQHKLQYVICDNMRNTNKNMITYLVMQNIYLNHQDIYAYQFIKEISPPPKFFS
jgi:hypothetical protein